MTLLSPCSLSSLSPSFSLSSFFFFFPLPLRAGRDGRPEAVLHGCSTSTLRCDDGQSFAKRDDDLKPLVSCFLYHGGHFPLLARAAATAISSSIPGVVEMARMCKRCVSLQRTMENFGSCENINVLNNGVPRQNIKTLLIRNLAL